jgi:hypothetical protein
MYFVIINRVYTDANFVITVICLVLFLIFTIFRKINQADDSAKYKIWKKQLLKGEQIVIPYEKIKIKGFKNSRSVPVTKNMDAQAWNQLVNPASSEKYVVNEYFHLEARHNGRLYKSDSIAIDKTVLEIKLYLQKGVNVYFDRESKRYVFDLDFLNSESI